jgi:hypothetical protein
VWKSFASAASLLPLLMAVGPACAQQAAAKPDSAEAKAAMERAQRMADNPMRVILQASKIKRKGNEADTPEPVVDPASVRRTAARSGAEPAARDASTAPVGASTRPAAPPPSVVATASPAVATPAPAPEPPPARVMPSALLATSAASSVPSLEAAQPLEAAPVTTKAVAPQAIPIVPANVRPTLVTMVEPEIPVRLLSDSGRVGEIFADLSLREDGTVAAVTLLPPVPRSWARYISAALEKWRFEALPVARVHRVQLVFDDNK